VQNYTLDKLVSDVALVGDVAAVLKHFQQDKATIVGHDWGGAIVSVARAGDASFRDLIL
jgi:pimeloyl-ACP methyl ester carboxylesterase